MSPDPRKILVLSVVLAALAAVAFFVQGPGRRHQVREAAYVFPAFDPGRVQSVSVEGENLLSLERGPAGGWFVASGESRHRADGQSVESALEEMKNLRRDSVASTNVQKRSLFGVDEAQGVKVRMADAGGEPVLECVVGKEGPDFFSGYLQRPGEEEVLLVSANLKSVFARSLEGWRDRKIVKAGGDDIVKVTIRRGEEGLALEKDEQGNWQAAGGAVDPQAVGEYLDRLVNLRASGFASEDEISGAGLDTPAGEITIGAGSQTLTLTVGALKEEAGQRYLRAGDEGTVYLVSQYAADGLLKKKEDFPPPAGENEGEGEEVESVDTGDYK